MNSLECIKGYSSVYNICWVYKLYLHNFILFCVDYKKKLGVRKGFTSSSLTLAAFQTPTPLPLRIYTSSKNGLKNAVQAYFRCMSLNRDFLCINNDEIIRGVRTSQKALEKLLIIERFQGMWKFECRLPKICVEMVFMMIKTCNCKSVKFIAS